MEFPDKLGIDRINLSYYFGNLQPGHYRYTTKFMIGVEIPVEFDILE